MAVKCGEGWVIMEAAAKAYCTGSGLIDRACEAI